jgi:hypothetical protein
MKRGCFNCAYRGLRCDFIRCSESEYGKGFWCPENCASIKNEVEERSMMKRWILVWEMNREKANHILFRMWQFYRRSPLDGM